MKAVLSLQELRELIRPPVEKELFAFSRLADGGLPKGAITEISGPGKTELTLALLAEHPEAKVAWVEESFSVYPFGFLQRNIDLGRVLFVESGGAVSDGTVSGCTTTEREARKNTCWSVLQILKAQVFSVVVIYAERFELSDLRKIQLASEKSAATVLWLSPEPSALWPVSLQVSAVRERHNTVEHDEHGLVRGHIIRRRC